MNLLFLVTVAIFLLLMLIGYKRGLIKSVLSMVGIVGAILITNWLHPYVSNILCEYTIIDDVIALKIENGLGVSHLEEDSVYQQEEFLESTALPENIKDYIRSSDTVAESRKQVDGYVAGVVKYLTEMTMKGLAYVLTFLVIMLIALFLLGLAKFVDKIPIVGGIDKVGGLLVGLIQAIVIVWLFMLVITFLSAFSWADGVVKMIEENVLLKFLYDKDIFLKMVVDILSDI
jgi:uncharacterized membrane protein required for colicin V production